MTSNNNKNNVSSQNTMFHMFENSPIYNLTCKLCQFVISNKIYVQFYRFVDLKIRNLMKIMIYFVQYSHMNCNFSVTKNIYSINH